MTGKFSLIKNISVLQLDCVIVSGLLTLIVGVVYWLLPPFDPADLEKLSSLFIPVFRDELRPEPGEQRTYLLGLALLPVIAGLVVWFQRRGMPLLAGTGLWVALFGVMLFYNGDWLREIFYATTASRMLQALAAMVFSLTLAALFWYRIKINATVVWWVAVAVGMYFTVCFSLYQPEKITSYFAHHFEIICYAVSQSAAGNPTLHQYGFYPDFLGPVLQLTGVSIRNLNLIFSTLIFLTFLLMFGAFWQFCRNKIVGLVYVVLMVYFSNSLFNALRGICYDPYFAYYPIRTIVPALSIFLVMRYLKFEHDRRTLPLLGAVAGAGVFWNLDSGITVAVALFAFFAVETLTGWYYRRLSFRPLLVFAGWFFAVLPVVWLLLCWRHGIWLTPQVLFKYQKIFAGSGYFMLPVQPLPDAWAFFAGVPVIALVWAFFLGKNSPGNATGRWVLYLSILSLGLFSYYFGRSHLLVLSSVIYPVLIILTVWLDGAFRMFRIPGLKIYSLLLSVPILVLFSLALPVFAGVFPEMMQAGKRHIFSVIKNQPGILEEKAELVRDFARGGKINIFGRNQGLLYIQSQTVSGIADSGEIEVILQADRDRILTELERSSYPLVICAGDPKRLAIPQAMLDQYYRLVLYDPVGILFYLPKKGVNHAE